MDRILYLLMGLQRVARPRYALAVMAVAILAASPADGQTKRILLVGDSWAQYAWNGNAWSPVLDTYGLSQWDDEGSTTAIGGTTASLWVDPGALDLITQALATYPTIDIIHLSIGGNDMLAGQGGGGWHTGLTGAQESALFDTIQANIETIIEHCLSIRPDIKVGIIDYDYLNLWETSLAGIPGAQLMQLNLGNPSPSQINGAFTRMGERKRQIAATHDRVLYVHNWGLQQYRHGHPGFWDAGLVNRPPFGSGISPVPGWPPGYVPYPGGIIEYPGPRNGLANDGDDPIHLNSTGYKDLCSSALGQGFAAWLADTTGPRVQSITRTGASPTDALQVSFLVTFSESVRTVTAGDFAIDADPAITGAGIASVSGSGATRTVTLNRGTGNGLLSIDFVDHDTVYDQNWRPAGDDLNAPGDGSFTNGQAYLIDDEVPGVTLTPSSPSPTFLNAVPFTVQFTEPVTGFTSNDIVVTVSSGSGTAQVSAFSGQGAAYTFTLQTAHTTTILVNVQVPAGVALDAAGNGNLAETYTGYEFTTPSGLGDPYVSNGSNGSLIVPAAATVSIDTDGVKPSLSINGGPVIEGEVITISGGEVAKFNFVEVDVPASATVTITGLRPLAIAASEDIAWDATIDV
ncbi:MAG: hypothetical protein IT368_02400, partial [Candidatus Hydrogenedentes bacterium]|nr:hypothetical protein [Candidatus Hydrogenedentota bacterium]